MTLAGHQFNVFFYYPSIKQTLYNIKLVRDCARAQQPKHNCIQPPASLIPPVNPRLKFTFLYCDGDGYTHNSHVGARTQEHSVTVKRVQAQQKKNASWHFVQGNQPI